MDTPPKATRDRTRVPRGEDSRGSWDAQRKRPVFHLFIIRGSSVAGTSSAVGCGPRVCPRRNSPTPAPPGVWRTPSPAFSAHSWVSPGFHSSITAAHRLISRARRPPPGQKVTTTTRPAPTSPVFSAEKVAQACRPANPDLCGPLRRRCPRRRASPVAAGISGGSPSPFGPGEFLCRRCVGLIAPTVQIRVPMPFKCYISGIYPRLCDKSRTVGLRDCMEGWWLKVAAGCW